MKNQKYRRLLGSKLIEAGIISQGQLDVALEDQKYYNDLRLGEILIQRNWIKERTADFFASQQPIKKFHPKEPIGYYLKSAALLTQAQINIILEEQEKIFGQRFGEIAIDKKWIKPKTIRYFVENLNYLYNDNNFEKDILYISSQFHHHR